MTRKRCLLYFALTAALLLSACDNAQAPKIPQQFLQPTELGKVRIGMTPQEASAALSAPLRPFNPDEPGANAACWYTQRIDGMSAWVRYMVQDDKIVRIEVNPIRVDTGVRFAPPVMTDEGITIDTPEQSVIDKYGARVRISPHKYEERGRYLEVAAPDGKAGILFETIDGKVETFRAGMIKAIRLVEGCS